MTTQCLPQNYCDFLKEYEIICKKYNLMVFSEGEDVWVGEADENLWDVKEETIYKFKHCAINHQR